MKFALADPPYPGEALRRYGKDNHGLKAHEDFDGEVDHRLLIRHLVTDFPDGWVLCTKSSALAHILPLCPQATRVMAWCKPFCAWGRNRYPAYTWEPALMYGGRNRFGDVETPRDYLLEPMSTRRGVVGAKPDAWCFWIFECLGATEDDELVDLFPGSGAVGAAWERFVRTPRMAFPSEPTTESLLG
jgi:hypothetical protein